MDHPNVSPGHGRGRGRGRGFILQQAIQEAASVSMMTYEANAGKMSNTQERNTSTVSDEDIKNWLKQALTKSKGGIWKKQLQKLFSETFQVSAPDDLIMKIQSWSDLFQIDSIVGGEIVRPSDEFLAVQEENAKMGSETNVGKTPTSEYNSVPQKKSRKEGDKSNVSDEDIKNWLKEALTKYKGGIWKKQLPKLFSEKFQINAPDDLIMKIQSWSDLFQIDSIVGGEIVRPSGEFLAVQKENAKESVPNVATVSDKVIRIWLKKELCQRQSGIPTTDISILFKETFRASAPEDLITKLRSWPNVVQIQSIQGREIMTLTPTSSPSLHHTCIPYEHNKKLNSMMQDLNACLTAETNTMTKAALVQGGVYAGKYAGNWYRVIVQGFTEDDKVNTCFADYCSDVMLIVENLKELPTRFHSLPFGSFKARLQGVDPADGSSQWSEKAKQTFSLFTRERDFVCLICESPDDNDVVSVRLVDTSSDEDVVVDEIMEQLDLVVRLP